MAVLHALRVCAPSAHGPRAAASLGFYLSGRFSGSCTESGTSLYGVWFGCLFVVTQIETDHTDCSDTTDPELCVKWLSIKLPNL